MAFNLIEGLRLNGFLFFFFLIAVSSCKSHFGNLTEALPGNTARALRATGLPSEEVDPSENIVLLGTSAAVYTISLARGIPSKSVEKLASLVDRRIAEMPFYSTVRNSNELASGLSTDGQLDRDSQLYFKSLTRVSVSNKDISNRIGETLRLKNLIVCQVDKWPCSDCAQPLRMRVKLRAIDLPSGLIIWTGINELETPQPDDASEKQLLNLADSLLSQFQKRFERKWHQKRVHHLRQLAQK